MKKIFLCAIFAIMIADIFSSCQKEGPAGPAGAAGPAGVAGAAGQKGDKGDQGADGSMQIVVKDITISSWTPLGAASQHTGKATVAEITDNIINGGGVIAYYVSGKALYGMPYVQVDTDRTYRHIITKNTFSVQSDYSTSKPAPGSIKFRLIIIPGALGKRVSSSSGTGYSIDQLRTMSYERVCELLKIQP